MDDLDVLSPAELAALKEMVADEFDGETIVLTGPPAWPIFQSNAAQPIIRSCKQGVCNGLEFIGIDGAN